MNKRKIRVISSLALVVCLVLVVFLTSCGLKVNNGEAASLPFVNEATSLKIAHITDTHYYPLNYCYHGAIEGTDYERALIGGTKPLPENGRINSTGLKKITTDTNYLVVTGDLTYDGEIQGHIELANLLRKTQNDIRAKGNADFQVFVIPGNHDMYNVSSFQFRDAGKRVFTGHETTRYDITKIYSSLGYPDLTDEEIETYYTSIDSGIFFDNLPYEGRFVNSETAESVNIEYQYANKDEGGNLTIKEESKEGANDYKLGYITYVATGPNNNAIVAFDEEISDNNVKHYVGGKMHESAYTFLRSDKIKTLLSGRRVYGIQHHNAIPHFKGEDSLLKDFTIFGWKENLDFYTELGIKYIFTGHMHTNDIVTASSFTNKQLTDIETAAFIGHNGGARYCNFTYGKVGGEDAIKLDTNIDLIGSLDFTDIFSRGYMSDAYMQIASLNSFIKREGSQITCPNASDYLTHKLFLNIIENLKSQYINPKFISGLGDMVSEMLEGQSNAILKNLAPLAKVLIDNIIDHFELQVLADYEYKGTNALYKTKERGAKLCGYVEDLVNSAINMPVNKEGRTLFDFGMKDCYLRHLGGNDIPYAAASEGDKEALDNLKNGKIIKDLLNILLDKEKGLYRIVEGLTKPINLGKGMTAEQLDSIKGLFSLIKEEKIEFDPNAVLLDNHLNKALGLVGPLLGINFSLEGKTIMEFVDETLDSYVTESLYTSLGEIAHDILYAFMIDETGDTESSFHATKQITYYPNEELKKAGVSFLASAQVEAPSIENGKLPSMLSVTFGKEATTDKNFSWFTDPRVSGGYIQYMEGEFNASSAKEAVATSELFQTTTANIDLGIFATLLHVNITRHQVSLTNLTPGTTYTYRVGSKAEGFWSPVYSFKTAPKEGSPFDILMISDIQGSAKTTYETSAKIMGKMDEVFENGYDFTINCGDLVDNGKNLVQWDYFLNILQGYWGNTTQVVASGNHEKSHYKAPTKDKEKYSLVYEGGISNEYNYAGNKYNLVAPEQNLSSGTYYSFNYSDVHFAVLNTNDLDSKNNMSKQQIDWLKEDLSKATQKHKVVLMHKGIYSSGAHSYDKDVINMRAQLTPIFAENNVHIVFQGHDHTYSESFYLDGEGNKVKSNAQGKSKIGDNGTLYVTLGTMGDKYYKYVENPEVPIEFGKKLHKPTLQNPTFGKLSYDGNDLYYEGYQYNLSNDKISKVRSSELLWWHILLITVGAAGVVASIAVISVSISRKVKPKKAA